MSASVGRNVRSVADIPADQFRGRVRSLPDKRCEARFQQAVRAYAQELGYLVCCTHDSRRSPEGEPDLRLLHVRRKRFVWIELKGPSTAVSRQQTWYLNALRSAGFEAFLFRPMDVEHIIEVLEEAR